MGLDQSVPNRGQSTFPNKEEIGTGNGSTTKYYFDVGNVIEYSETLYYGASEILATNTLTRTTHYSVDYDKGIITLTSAGVTLLSTNKLYGEYSFITRDNPTNTMITEALERAESELERDVRTVFFDGTAATPDFDVQTNEIHEGQGYYLREYSLDEFPVYDATTTLNGAVSADDSTITVVSTNGFASSGTIAINTNKINYTGKTSTTFTGCSNVLAHSDGETVTSFVFEASYDAEGNEPSWTVLEYLVDYDIDFEAGVVKITTSAALSDAILDDYFPPRTVWNRFRASYQSGYDSVPLDIVRCVHYMAGKELFGAQMLNSITRGTDGFNVEGFSTIQGWIDETIRDYKILKIKCTQP